MMQVVSVLFQDEFQTDTDRFPLPDGMHVYKGIIHHKGSPADILDNLNTLDIREGDWLVATYPKSGKIQLYPNHECSIKLMINIVCVHFY